MDAYPIQAFPLHITVKHRQNTDEAAIGKFWQEKGEHYCEAFNCTMTREGCAERKTLAAENEKEHGNYNIYGKCLDCKGAKKMDAKKCHVEGCGRKVLAKGMCSTHYFRARENEKKAAASETKPTIPETKTPEPEKGEGIFARFAKNPPPDKQPYPPKEPDPPKPTKKPNGTKRVNVQFVGPDVALWEKLKARARKNRRDLRTECLCIIEDALAPRDEPEVYS